MNEIKTQRLLLRPLRLGDLDDFYAYACVPGVGEAAGWAHHANKGESLKILKSMIESGRVFGIEYLTSHKLIGTLELRQSDNCLDFPKEDEAVEIGYVLAKSYWGDGLMTEAVQAVLRYVFTKTVTKTVIICTYDFNAGSRRVIAKCGLRKYKIIADRYIPVLDSTHDEICYRITSEEYFRKA